MKRRRNKFAAPRKNDPKNGPKTFRQVVKLIHQICCLAGSPTLIDDIRSDGSATTLGRMIEVRDTAALFDWLIVTLSFQGISDSVASGYIERNGSIAWSEIELRLSKTPSCPKLQSYWHFNGCGYRKGKGTCSRPDHYTSCPVPKHRLRNGRLNQLAYSLFLFLRDIADADLVGWVDARLAHGPKPKRNSLSVQREALLGPLRNVYGIADKVVSLAFASILLAAPRERSHWHELGGSMIAIDTLVHKLFHRTGILRAMNAEHPYGLACYAKHGCAGIIERASSRIDASQFNGTFPRVFPRYVQYALWRYCAQEALNTCNSNRIADDKRCSNDWCQLYRRCARRRIGRFK